VNDITLFHDCVMFSLIKGLIFAKRRLSHRKIDKVNTSEIKKNWSKQEEKLKQKFATVTDNDLTFERGKNEKMSGVLQVKWGKTKEELHKNIEVL
jgi:uncharacterized protein YjbJ (UPF0337 family)